MVTSLAARIDQMTTGAASTLVTLFKPCVPCIITSFRYQFFVAVAAGWARKLRGSSCDTESEDIFNGLSAQEGKDSNDSWRQQLSMMLLQYPVNGIHLAQCPFIPTVLSICAVSPVLDSTDWKIGPAPAFIWTRLLISPLDTVGAQLDWTIPPRACLTTLDQADLRPLLQVEITRL